MKPCFPALSVAAPLLLISGTALAHPGHDGGHLNDFLAVALLAFLGLLAAYLYRLRAGSEPADSEQSP